MIDEIGHARKNLDELESALNNHSIDFDRADAITRQIINIMTM